MRKFSIFILLLFAAVQAYSQQFFTETFNDTAGKALTSSGWTAIGPGAVNPIKINAFNLSYPGYVLSGQGNSVSLNTTGQDVYRNAEAAVNTGNVYVSFMMSDSAAATGNYVLALLPSNVTNTLSGRIYVKAASAGYYKIGIAKYTEAAVYSTDSFPINTTQLFVLKYHFVSGTLNDSVYLYAMKGSMTALEPSTPTIATASSAVADITNIGRIALNQVTTGSSPKVTIGGIRMSANWAGLLAPTHTLPNPAGALTFTANGPYSGNLSWLASSGYNPATMTYLVFARQTTAITTTGLASWPVSAYSPNSNFALANSRFQFDTLARCIYAGDSIQTALTGLNQLTTYQFAIYVVHDADSLYSSVITGNGRTFTSAPNPVTGLSFAATAPQKAHISWNLPVNYNAASNTILVFMKSGANITPGATRNKNPNTYFTDTIFPGNATKYQNDTAARCIYKGDGTSVDVKGLALSTNYFLLAYAVNDADSNYSTGANANGMSSSAGPLALKKASFITGVSGHLSLSWTKDSTYNPATETILVYLKKTNAVTGPNTNKYLNPTLITADSNMSGLGTKLPSDTAAFCVYKGDGNAVEISGLASTTIYYAVLYAVTDADTACSNAITANGTTRPAPVSNLRWSSNGPTVGTIAWTAPTGYVAANFTTLVFVKKDSAIVNGVPTKSPNRYTANTAFGSGTGYEFDTAAHCVYKGDQATVNITGLVNTSNYYVTVWVVHDVDSIYSTNADVHGKPAPNPLRSITFTATAAKKAHVSWVPPTGYDPIHQSILIFMKAGSAITAGAARNKNPNSYFTDTIFPGNATRFQNDTAARCIYNGDSTFVDVTGLGFTLNYYLLGYVVNDADSNYSNGVNATGLSNSAGPLGVKKPLITAGPTGQLHLTWQKDSLYDSANETILVYLKKGNTITTPNANKNINPANVTVDTTMSGAGTKLPSDTAAFCVYKGDGNAVDVTNLAPTTNYVAVFFAVSDPDTACSNSISAIGMTRPAPVSALKWSSTSATNAVITWTQPTGYTANAFSTLVFIKKSVAINAGTPTQNGNRYTANTAFGLGTKYQNDSMAYCVLRGDQTTVTITGLSNQFTYYVSAFVVHDADSLYSAEAFVSGMPLPPPPYYKIAQVNHVNASTGNPDSLNVRATLSGIVYGFNQSATGLRFIMRDETGGIGVISTTKNYGYTVKQGDTIEVQGTISVARGFTNITNLDTLYVFGSGKTLKTPSYLTAKLAENNESDLVRIDSLRFITVPTGNWPTNGTVNCYLRKSTDTVTIRLFNTSALAGKPYPKSTYFSVQGLVVQNSTSATAPFAFNGYQLVPRDTNDVFVPMDTLFTAFTADPTGPNSLHVSWKKPITYNDASMTTLVFARPGSIINTYNLQKDTLNNIASANWQTKGSAFINDAQAFCIYKGDSLQMDFTGLSASTTYELMILAKTDADSILHYTTLTNNTTTTTAPFPMQNLAFTPSGVGTAYISWTKPKYFDAAKHTMLVFMKPVSAITQGTTRNTNPASIVADTVFPGNASAFQNDASAFCIYNGTGTSVNVSNLLYSTNYYLLAYAVNKADSNYATGITASGLSNANGPVAVTQLLLKSVKSGVLKISWKKDATYRNTQFTTVVYLKKSGGINTPSQFFGSASIHADTVFGLGSKLSGDSLAYCVYKGDSQYTYITGLAPGSNYYAMVYVFRDADSAYSNGTVASGTTPLNPPSGLKMTGTTLSSVSISWTPPVGYVAGSYSTLVFVKQDQAEFSGDMQHPASYYTASNIYGSGTPSELDANAYCVFNGNGSTANVYGLNDKHTYYAQVFIVHNADSSYSTDTITWGTTISNAKVYAIASINHVNATTGVPDSLNVRATVRGVVYGFNQNITGLYFTFRDQTGGIFISSNSKTFGYSVNEGDSLEIQGTITVNRGLTEISSLDTILVLGTNASLKTPSILYSKLSETNESDLVMYPAVKFITRPTSGLWPTNTTINCISKATGDTVTVRMFTSSQLAGKAIPTTEYFSITGTVIQSSASLVQPFQFNGYQIVPRSTADINPVSDSLTVFNLLYPAADSLVSLQGDTTQKLRFTWHASKADQGMSAPVYSVAITDNPANIETPIAMIPANLVGADTSLTISFKSLADLIGLEWNTQTNWYWSVLAQSGSFTRWANSTNMIVFKRGTFTGVQEINTATSFTLYPNPATDMVHISGTSLPSSIEVFDLSGKRVIETTQSEFSIQQLQTGMYFVHMLMPNNQRIIQKLMVQ